MSIPSLLTRDPSGPSGARRACWSAHLRTIRCVTLTAHTHIHSTHAHTQHTHSYTDGLTHMASSGFHTCRPYSGASATAATSASCWATRERSLQLTWTRGPLSAAQPQGIKCVHAKGDTTHAIRLYRCSTCAADHWHLERGYRAEAANTTSQPHRACYEPAVQTGLWHTAPPPPPQLLYTSPNPCRISFSVAMATESAALTA